MDPTIISSILSLLGTSGAGSAGSAGAAEAAGAAGAAKEAGLGSKVMGGLLDGAGVFDTMLKKNQDYFYEPPKTDEKEAEEGQKNASGSNAPLDNALGADARKTLGVSEGGSLPQLDNTLIKDLTGIKRTPTATQGAVPRQEGLFTKLSNWWNGLGTS